MVLQQHELSHDIMLQVNYVISPLIPFGRLGHPKFPLISKIGQNEAEWLS